jgi:hypothetical protein
MKVPLVLLLLLSLSLVGRPAHAGELPAGWIKAGSQPNDYDMGTDSSVHHGGKSSAFIKAKPGATEQGFGTLMQMAAPGQYLGKRVRFSAWAKAEDVTGWAGLWMRVDGTGNKMLSFDNMQGRPIKGTQPWTRHEIVLDVPDGAQALAFGVLLAGQGAVWIDDLAFEVVPDTVPVTQSSGTEPPRNLNFEQ